MRSSYKVVLLSLVEILSQASSILMTLCLVRFLSQQAYGTFRQAFLVVSTFSYLLNFYLPASLLYFFPKMERSEQKGILIQTICALVTLGFIGSLAVFALSEFIAGEFHNPQLESLFRYFAFYIVFEVTVQYISPMFMGIDQYKKASIIQLFMNVSRLVVVGIALVAGAGVRELLQTILVFMGVQAAVILTISWRCFRDSKTTWHKRFIGQQFSYALPMGLSSVVWFLGKEIDKYFLALYFTPTIYSLYVIGALEIPLFRAISNAIRAVLIPQIAQLYHGNQRQEIAEIWGETMRKSMLLFLPAAVGLYLVAEPMIVTLFTIDYLGAVPVFKIYLVMVCFRIFHGEVIVQALGKTRIIFITSCTFVVLNIILNYVSIKIMHLGIIGPALATIIASFTNVIMILIASLHHLGYPLRQIFPGKAFLRIILTLAGAYAGGYCSQIFVSGYFWRGLVSGTTFGVIFVMGGWLLRIFTFDDIEMVLGRFGLSRWLHQN